MILFLTRSLPRSSKSPRSCLYWLAILLFFRSRGPSYLSGTWAWAGSPLHLCRSESSNISLFVLDQASTQYMKLFAGSRLESCNIDIGFENNRLKHLCRIFKIVRLSKLLHPTPDTVLYLCFPANNDHSFATAWSRGKGGIGERLHRDLSIGGSHLGVQVADVTRQRGLTPIIHLL
jgi:hypothetical protein